MSSPAEKTDESNQQLIQSIKEGDKYAFEKLFYRYYRDLCGLACKITQCPEQARDVVQDVLLKLWKKRESWQIKTSLKAYLYQAVWNEALNVKNKKDSQQRLKEEFSKTQEQHFKTETVGGNYRTKQLVTEIWNIVDTMAERRKFVFILHRKHGLSYKEIARVMKVTRKTVENHMGLALQEIRDTISPDLLK